MEYRGKQYTIVQGIGPNLWKWTVRLDEKTVKSGEATSRPAAMLPTAASPSCLAGCRDSAPGHSGRKSFV
jgi:hypothetical protein